MKVELIDAGVSRGPHEVLRNVHFRLQGAGSTVITGRSSSGKSTLVELMSGMIQPTSGQCILSLQRSSIGIVEQHPSFHEQMSAYDNVMLAAAARSLSKQTATTSALELFADLGISHIRSSRVCDLSSWERTLVAIARAWIGDTEMVLLDQVLDGHDEIAVRSLLDTIVRINQRECSLVVTTTQPSIALLLPSAEVYELRDGTLTNISKLPSVESQSQNGEQS